MLRHSPSAPLSPSVLFGLDSKLFLKRAEEEEKFKGLGWEAEGGHGGEIETMGVFRGGEGEEQHKSDGGHVHSEGCGHDLGSTTLPSTSERTPAPSWEDILAFLSTLPSTVYRVKGLLNLLPPPASTLSSTSSSSATPFSAQPLPTPPMTTPGTPTSKDAPSAPTVSLIDDPDAGLLPTDRRLYILNWAFGRYTLTRVPKSVADGGKTYEGVDVRLTLMGERGEVKKWGRRMAKMVGGLAR